MLPWIEEAVVIGRIVGVLEAGVRNCPFPTVYVPFAGVIASVAGLPEVVRDEALP